MLKLTLFSLSLIASVGLKGSNNLIENKPVEYKKLEYLENVSKNDISLNEESNNNNINLSDSLINYNFK